MEYIRRDLQMPMARALARNKSVLLLGARQTGKSTLLERLKGDLLISFVPPHVRQRYEKNPSLLRGEVEGMPKKKRGRRPLVFLDEIQKVPMILDVVQDLIDHKKANFVLTGSSARKLRHGPHVNLLPGRVVSLKLDPLSLAEAPPKQLQNALLFGSLPGIQTLENNVDKETDLESYVTTYLEEEVRAEAIVRNVGSFARFLELAASESGLPVNFRKLSQEIGISHTTIASYYEILEDCLIAERVEPLTKSKARKKLTKSHKYMFFDLGVRRVAAREGSRLPRETLGHLFEQFVGLELLRASRFSKEKVQLKFWRDPDGPEVDWVLEKNGKLIPIEVKWTDSPSARDIKHLQVFQSEYNNAQKGFVVCRTPRPIKLSDQIMAWPWQKLLGIIEK